MWAFHTSAIFYWLQKELNFTIFIYFFSSGLKKWCDSRVQTHVAHLSRFVMTCLLITWKISLFFLTVLQMKQRHDVTEATQAQMWITQTHTCQSSVYQTPYSFYLPLIHDRTSQQPLEDTSKEYGTFSPIPSFPFVLQELLAQNKVRSCWGVWEVFFMCDFSDRRCAGQWIYKGTSAFKNIRKETFPTQTDR